MQNEQGVAGGHENAIPGPHHGPHVSQLNRDYANLLRERDPSLYEDLVREPTEEFQFDETSKNSSHKVGVMMQWSRWLRISTLQGKDPLQREMHGVMMH